MFATVSLDWLTNGEDDGMSEFGWLPHLACCHDHLPGTRGIFVLGQDTERSNRMLLRSRTSNEWPRKTCLGDVYA